MLKPALVWGSRIFKAIGVPFFAVALSYNTKASAAEVTITSPANGSIVGGNVTVKMSLASNVWWTWLYIDGQPGPSGYNPLIWNSSGVSQGPHTLTIRAFPRGS